MRVLVVQPNSSPEERSIGDAWEDLKAVVGGNIEQVYVSDDLLVIMNEEWRSQGAAWCNVGGHDIGGTFLFVGDDEDGASYASLSDEQLDTARALLEENDSDEGDSVEMFLNDESFSVPSSWTTIDMKVLRQAFGVPGFMPIRIGSSGALMRSGSTAVEEGKRFYVCSPAEAVALEVIADYTKIAEGYGLRRNVYFSRALHELVGPGGAQEWLDRLYEIFHKTAVASRAATTPEFDVEVSFGNTKHRLRMADCQPGYFFGFAAEYERD